jgi:hypothetical protein
VLTAGSHCLLDRPWLAKWIGELSADIGYQIVAVGAAVEHPPAPTDDLEWLNAALVSLKDARWAIDHGRLHFAAAAAGLAGRSHNAAAVRTWSLPLGVVDLGRRGFGIWMCRLRHGGKDVGGDMEPTPPLGDVGENLTRRLTTCREYGDLDSDYVL